MVNRPEYRRILEKYLDGTISREEHDELFSITTKENVDQILAEMMDMELRGKITGADLPPHISEDILRNILIAEKNAARVLDVSSRKKYTNRIAAACILALILTAAYFFTGSRPVLTVEAGQPAAENNIEKKNNSSSPYIVLLGDGSKVVLQPGATINYPSVASGSREVYLKGEAFFNVVKNPAKPFRVYCSNIVTQVLGTSFTVKTNPSTSNIEVTVRSGKVQVYENLLLPAHNNKVKGVIITQNQKVIYYKEQRAFETMLSDSLQPVATHNSSEGNKENSLYDFCYKKPVSLQAILNQLHDAYGVDIVVENENIYNCLFTGDLSKQDVYKKLDIICRAVDAQYDVKGTRILISGKGCN